jgi:hypothetical protein
LFSGRQYLTGHFDAEPFEAAERFGGCLDQRFVEPVHERTVVVNMQLWDDGPPDQFSFPAGDAKIP